VGNGLGDRRGDDFCGGSGLGGANRLGLRRCHWRGDWFCDDRLDGHRFGDGHRHGLRFRLNDGGRRGGLLGDGLDLGRWRLDLGDSFGWRGDLGRCGLLRCRLLDRLDFLGLLLAGQTITNCATF
jgi:hypothetical protein